MNKLSGILAVLFCSAVLSAGSVCTASAAVKVTKNTAAETAVQQDEADPQAAEEAQEEQEETTEAGEEDLRQQVVDYALSFVGGSYVYGGTDPHNGVDCSGFTRYILGGVAGVDLPHSAKVQSGEGVTVSADTMQPGDLLFYAKGNSVNHVAMYIGNGKVVHASTEKTGIKISDWNYRTPVRIASFLG